MQTAPLRLQIVPPGPGGVHDFAAALRTQWARHGRPSELLALDRVAARRQSLAGLLMALCGPTQPSCSVLLHFSGYGYERRGLCGWLLHELRGAQQRLGPRLRIVTLFHELFASGPPWRSAFWLAPWQARIASQLAALSGAVATNTAQHARWLQQQPGVAAVQTRPVFSNFAQPQRLPALAEREPALVIFGSAATRARALRRLASHTQTLHTLGVQGLTEVGPGPATILRTWPQQHLGHLPQAEVSRQLQRHRFALIDYPAPYLAKSGVLAAYAAHGCAVLNTAAPAPDADGLRAGQHYRALLSMKPARVGGDGWQAMADALHVWHDGHTLPLQARELGALLEPVD